MNNNVYWLLLKILFNQWKVQGTNEYVTHKANENKGNPTQKWKSIAYIPKEPWILSSSTIKTIQPTVLSKITVASRSGFRHCTSLSIDRFIFILVCITRFFQEYATRLEVERERRMISYSACSQFREGSLRIPRGASCPNYTAHYTRLSIPLRTRLARFRDISCNRSSGC